MHLSSPSIYSLFVNLSTVTFSKRNEKPVSLSSFLISTGKVRVVLVSSTNLLVSKDLVSVETCLKKCHLKKPRPMFDTSGCLRNPNHPLCRGHLCSFHWTPLNRGKGTTVSDLIQLFSLSYNRTRTIRSRGTFVTHMRTGEPYPLRKVFL